MIQQTLATQLIEKAQSLRKNEIIAAESKITQFNNLKDTLKNGVARALEILQDTANTIKQNARTNERPSSLLTKPEGDYLSCLKLSEETLDRLLIEDAKVWDADLEVQKKKLAETLNDLRQENERYKARVLACLSGHPYQLRITFRELPLMGFKNTPA